MGVPVLTVPEMRQWEEASWNAGRHAEEVIAQVGVILAQRVLELTQPGDAILILAGKGNNGADARAIEEHLLERRVWVMKIIEPRRAFSKVKELLGRKPALVIDGLFGIGLNRELEPEWCSLIEAVNDAALPVLSVDTPSGLDAQTGEVRGAAIKATWTVTLGAPKVGLIQTRAVDWVGRLELAEDIGLIPWSGEADLAWATAEDFTGFPPLRPINGHKGTFGHVVLIGGSVGYHGAALLAARGAQRAQPGLVTLCVPPEVYVPVAAQTQSVMVHPWKAGWELPGSATAIVVGPGLAAQDLPEELKQWIRELWRTSTLPMVVDASALGWLPEGSIGVESIRVITPHPGETARMLGGTTGEVQKDRLKTLRELSMRWGRTWVVLKGLHTLTGRSADAVTVNSSGNPGLAQGGSGDVLAGYLGGLLAQPRLQKDIRRTLAYAVWQHGAAADALANERKVWGIEELLPYLGTI
jgi:hydroxyethylthiazole kinase-like uncharacterized protein yjeF